MSLTQIENHVAEAKAYLIEQFKQLPNWEALLEAWIEQVQQIEDMFFELLQERVLDTAIGVHLDNLGAIVGQERLGASDEVYRLRIKARTKSNVSGGTPEEIIEILLILAGASATVRIEDYYPAAFETEITDEQDYNSGQIIANIINDARAAGVYSILRWTEWDDEAFVFDGGTGGGFGEGTWFNADSGQSYRENVDWFVVERRIEASILSNDINTIAFDGDSRYVIGCDSGITGYSNDGLFFWETTNGFGTSAVSGIAYNGSDLFVAVGVAGKIETSSDGITWTTRTSGVSSRIQAVAYGGGQWIAVGNVELGDAIILTSPDGITWTERSNPSTTDLLRSVAYDGSGLWVAVGNANRLMTSPDGITWTTRTVPGASVNLYGVVYAGDQWIACGLSSKIITSPDGITWTEQSGGAGNQRGIGYDSDFGVTMIVAANGNVITSEDGITWIDRQIPGIIYDFNWCLWDGRIKWVIVGENTTSSLWTFTRRPNYTLGG